ncbi:MAG: hypothetical protein M9959_14080 [Chitinophagaceae bacterium]|nr:hypothetical protein [Chitinophagaceae bacterium]
MAADEVSKLCPVEKIRPEQVPASCSQIFSKELHLGGSETSSKPGTAKQIPEFSAPNYSATAPLLLNPDMRTLPAGPCDWSDDQLPLDITGDNLPVKLNVSPEDISTWNMLAELGSGLTH